MQRRDINKRLSFAEAENGQKDRNKEEVEEERELATEKGINKSGRGRERRTRREEGRKEKERGESSAAPAAGPGSLKSLVALLDQRPPIYYFRGIRYVLSHWRAFISAVCAAGPVAGVYTRASRYPRSHFFRRVRILEAR